MKKKNPIDDLFRSGLDGKGMDYDSKYWNQMDSMITAQQQRRKKKFLWIGLILLLVSIPGLILILPQSNTVQQVPSQQPAPEVNKQAPSVLQAIDASVQENENTSAPSAVTKKHKDEINTTPKPQLKASAVKPMKAIVGQPKLAKKKTETDSHTKESKDVIESKEVNRFESMDIPQLSALGIPLQSLSYFIGPDYLSLDRKTDKEQASKETAPNPRPLHYSLLAYTAYGQVNHRLAKDVQQWKKDRESVQHYAQYGLKMKVYRGRLGLTFGAGLLHWQEKRSYEREIKEYTLDSSIRLVKRNYQQRSDGSYIALVQTVYDTVSRSTRQVVDCPNCPTRFQYISLPIGAEYEFGNAKIRLITGAGLNFNLFLSSKGVYSTSLTAEGLTVSADNRAFAKVLTQAQINMGLAYRFLPGWSLSGQALYRRSLNSMMSTYRQQPDMLGLRLGLVWDIR